MSSTVSLYHLEKSIYPKKKDIFMHDKTYPEYPFKELSTEINYAYDAVRSSFILRGMDKDNLGKKDWNPLSNIIKPGDTVLLKPNMVMDINHSKHGDEKSLYTHPSIVAAMIDYTIIALKGRGKIILGDAPMQECDFTNLIENSGYKELVDYYVSKDVPIQLVDFRELSSTVKNGVHVSTINKYANGKIIDLGCDSDFHGESIQRINNMRITNYDPTIMPQHHNAQKHEYYISDYALDADVIINLPKPKCHRKAGMTAALKNFVGLNVRKEYLPHHTKGASNAGGDEYDIQNIIHDIRSNLLDSKNKYVSKQKIFKVQICRFLIKLLSFILKIQKKNFFDEGSWYGNKTIPCTVSDINRIIYYVDKNGVMQEKIQRKFFVVGDMIISGENEGPVLPTNKECGIIVMADNPITFDKTLATLMGFDYKKIPVIMNADKTRSKFSLHYENTNPHIISNNVKFDNIKIDQITWKQTFMFQATSGWKNHIEL